MSDRDKHVDLDYPTEFGPVGEFISSWFLLIFLCVVFTGGYLTIKYNESTTPSFSETYKGDHQGCKKIGSRTDLLGGEIVTKGLYKCFEGERVWIEIKK